jgi:hypothetical protein
VKDNYTPTASSDATRSWLINLPEGTVYNWDQLCAMFIDNFQGAYEHLFTVGTLNTIKQKHDDIARNAIPNIQDIEIKSRATVLIPPKCDILKFDIQLDFPTTNNVSEYEVLVTGLRLANDLGIQHFLIRADSQLVARQVHKDFDCNNEKMAEYLLELRGMPKIFDGFEVRYVP